MRRLAGFVALATTLLVAVVVSPDLEPPGSLLEVGLHHGAAQRQAAEELKSLSDESAGIVGGALQQSLKGFSPQKPDKEATDMVPATAAEKQSVYKANMGSSFEDIMGHDAQHKDGKSTGVNYYGDQHTQTGWHYGGPTAHPTQSIPIRRAMGYNRMAPLGTGDFYRETHPFHSVYTMNSTDGVYHPPGFDNTYFYTMPSSPQWGDSQKRASSNGGLSGLMKSRWPKGQPGFRWKSLAHASTLKKGTRSAWPQKDNWHFQNWDAIPDPQRAHQETVGSLDPESEANLQLTYGRMYPQWAPQQKFGGINGDKFLPYSKYKTQLNVPHPKKTGTHGFRYLKGKYYEKRYKDLVRGSAIDKLDNGGWGIVDNRVPIKTAVNQQAPKWLRKMRSNSGEPIGDALHNFWQGGSLVDASPGAGGRGDVVGYKEGKAGEPMEDHYGWLENVPKGHLNPFLGRRDEPEHDKSYNEDEFDPGESFMQKSKATQELAMQRQKLLNEGRHVQQQLKSLNSKIAHDTSHERDFKSSSRGAVKLAAPAGSQAAFEKANAAFAKAMASV